MKNAAWTNRPLGDLFEIGAGKTMSAAARIGDNKTAFLRTSNVLWDEIDLSTVDEMAISARDLPTKLVQRGDLLVCEGGEIGRAAIWNGEIEVMSFQNHLHRLRPRRKDVEPRFYVYFLQAGFTQLGLFEGAGNKTTIPNLSRNRLAALDVPHPDLDEQQSIARVLAHVRAASKLHEQSLVLAQDLKRAVMRTVFTNGLFGDALKETDIGLMPDSWSVVKLGDVCSLSTGTTPTTSRLDYYSGHIPFIKTGEIDNNRITNSSTFISERAVRDFSLKIFPAGTIFMAMYGQGKTRGKVSILEIPATTSQNAAAIQINRDITKEYLWHFLLSQYNFLREIGSLGHLSHLNLGYLREFLIPLPPNLDEQHEIAAVLDTIDRKIDLHRKKCALLDELFKALMHKLMTGQIRVADLDVAAIDVEATA